MINAQAEVKTVVVAQGTFAEHPESYSPRVFVKVIADDVRFYELLQDGQAIPWPKAPSGFDFWLIDPVASIHDINMVRA